MRNFIPYFGHFKHFQLQTDPSTKLKSIFQSTDHVPLSIEKMVLAVEPESESESKPESESESNSESDSDSRLGAREEQGPILLNFLHSLDFHPKFLLHLN